MKLITTPTKGLSRGRIGVSLGVEKASGIGGSAHPHETVSRGATVPAASLRVPYGVRDGVLVHASAVERGLACGCVCVECGTRLVARRGPKTRPHFAHHAAAGDCDGESLLHRLGKRILAQRMEVAIATHRPLNVQWGCERCDREHETDLVRGATGVAVEHTISTADGGRIRPDVAVFGRSGEPQTLAELVVTHEPDQGVYDYARGNGIAVAEFWIATVADLEGLENARTLRANKATLGCLTSSCSECGKPMRDNPARYSLHVVPAPCWKCGSDMKLALWEGNGGELHDYPGGSVFGPSGRSWGIMVEDGDGPDEDELAVARAHGATIRRHHSRTMGGSYQANTCPRCQAFVGAKYEGDYADRIHPSNRVATYSRCEHCRCGTCDCTGLPAPPTEAMADSPTPESRRANTVGGIRCGHCKGRHSTVQQVRECPGRYSAQR